LIRAAITIIAIVAVALPLFVPRPMKHDPFWVTPFLCEFACGKDTRALPFSAYGRACRKPCRPQDVRPTERHRQGMAKAGRRCARQHTRRRRHCLLIENNQKLIFETAPEAEWWTGRGQNPIGGETAVITCISAATCLQFLPASSKPSSSLTDSICIFSYLATLRRCLSPLTI